MTDSNDIKCRNCGKFNLKVYEDGSGFCLDCDDSFANINDYGLEKNPVMAGDPENLFNKKDTKPAVSKWKNPETYMFMIANMFFLFGLIFIVLGVWSLYLSSIFGVFVPYIITLLICGIMFFLSGLALNDNEFKRSFYFLIVISILLLLQGLYEIYRGLYEFDITCLCPISFLLIIVFLAFLFLRMDKNKGQPKK